ncbi:hypothetical protein GINT2_000027 [Glugoides intestinalis]
MSFINNQKIELGNSSEEDPTKIIIDDIYILKSSLIENGKPAREAGSYLSQIDNIASQYPELCKNLYEWKILENEILYFLKSSMFDVALTLATRIISVTEKAPKLYFTKKFIFAVTERLYFAIGGKNIYKKNNYEIEKSDTYQYKEQNIFEEIAFENYTEDVGKINQTARKILLFFKKLVEINRSAVDIMNEVLLFELANACICVESSQLFNAVFKNITSPLQSQIDTVQRHWEQDGVYEIRRPHFDPEIIFRTKNILCLKKTVEKLKSGVFKKVYEQCTSLRDFADLSLNDTIDVLLYKKIRYMSDEFELQILEGRNPKIMKLYRRSLENGAEPSKSYLGSIIKCLDTPKTTRDASIILYYFREHLIEQKPFTENRIRFIMRNLEYMCDHECTLHVQVHRENDASQRHHTKEMSSQEKLLVKSSQLNRNNSFDSAMHSNDIFGESCNNGLFFTPKDLSEERITKNRFILEDLSEFGSDIVNKNEQLEEDMKNLESCEKYRILKLLQHLYALTNRQFFYKPSYLILFKSVLEHVPMEKEFVEEYFNDFVSFVRLNKQNIAKVFLPVIKPVRKPKMREIKLENEEADFEADTGLEKAVYDVENKENKQQQKKQNAVLSGIRLKGAVIESSEDDEF